MAFDGARLDRGAVGIGRHAELRLSGRARTGAVKSRALGQRSRRQWVHNSRSETGGFRHLAFRRDAKGRKWASKNRLACAAFRTFWRSASWAMALSAAEAATALPQRRGFCRDGKCRIAGKPGMPRNDRPRRNRRDSSKPTGRQQEAALVPVLPERGGGGELRRTSSTALRFRRRKPCLHSCSRSLPFRSRRVSSSDRASQYPGRRSRCRRRERLDRRFHRSPFPD